MGLRGKVNIGAGFEVEAYVFVNPITLNKDTASFGISYTAERGVGTPKTLEFMVCNIDRNSGARWDQQIYEYLKTTKKYKDFEDVLEDSGETEVV